MATSTTQTPDQQAPDVDSAAIRNWNPRTERRLCSVLFCDLVGFTPLAESRDAEEVRELLSGYFDLARAIVTRYGGTVDKFIGDAVMAVWGVPVAKEDDAERAVRAALELTSAVATYGSEHATALEARIGVATGEAATTETPEEGMVIGDRVNTASRIQSVAQPGSCYVDEATRNATAAAIAYLDVGEHELKGKAGPVRLYQALRVVAGVGGKQRADGLEAPFIGRDAELRALKDLFHSGVERRSPRLVIVSGPAGVGKSRLGWEFEKYADGLVDTILWHRGRCLSYGEGVSFWALAEVVRQRLGIAEEDPVEVAATKLAEGLVRFVGESERDYVGARLARLLGVETPVERATSLSREELFAGWRLFFERLAGVAPVVMLIEDAQHADSALLDFFDHLVDWTKDLPVFVLVFGRPELAERRLGFGVGRNRSTLSLDPVDQDSMEQIVEALVPGMTPEARAVITARAQGIPLFAVETIRSLIDAGLVQSEDGVYRLTGELSALAVPDSLHALLASRLDALEPATRSLVAVASVLGSTFPAEALVAVSGEEEAEVRAGLDELVRRDVLEVSADPLSPQRGDYRFSQEMLRQVAYETLSLRHRKARHLAVASYLRATFANDGEEIAEVIARHYLDALAAAPDDTDTSETSEAALSMLVRAAERAERAGAPARAALSYATAAGLVERESEQAGAPNNGAFKAALPAAALWERAARAEVTAANWERAVEHAGAARRSYTDNGEPRGAARSRTIAGEALRRAGRLGEAGVELSEALAVLRPAPDRDTVAALDELAQLELFGGNPEGNRLSDEALAMGEALDVDAALLARLFTGRGIAYAIANRTAEAASYYKEAAQIAERAGAAETLGRALVNLADALGGTDPLGSAEAARASAEHARRVGARYPLAISVANLVNALLELGEWDEADAELAAATQRDGLDDDVYVLGLKGLLAALRGEGEEASGVLSSLREFAKSEDVQTLANIERVEAFAAAALGRPSDALVLARVVIDRAPAVGIRSEPVRWSWPLAARVARELNDRAASSELVALLDGHPPGHLSPLLRAERALAKAWADADGGDVEAADGYVRAIEALRAVESPYHLAHGLLDHAAYLAQLGNAEGATTSIDEARAIAERLRCPPLARRAESLAKQF
ncbi:MAG TPA: adenylate/guanylate cyclase domain-containing protein, partial [Acidimicrobiales bacterium]|nr:adenylate/guanylate cyclase domain-containing protein [Acidimicrobiales bacterium]